MMEIERGARGVGGTNKEQEGVREGEKDERAIRAEEEVSSD